MPTRHTLDLRQIEQKAYLAVWDDGLVDLFVGVALVFTGTLWVFLDAVYGSFVAPMLVPLWMAARKHISEPRLGVVNFNEGRIRSQNLRLLVLFGLGLMGMALAVLIYVYVAADRPAAAREVSTNLIAGLPVALLALPAALVAVLFDLKRFFAYAFVFVVSAAPVVFLDLHPGWAFFPAGLFIMSQGAILLRRFVREYPVEE